jgi:hypothetical protein
MKSDLIKQVDKRFYLIYVWPNFELIQIYMSNLIVTSIKVPEPMIVAGKIFQGDYWNSQGYITEVKGDLEKASIPFVQTKVLGIYYDNPNEKKPGELRSFQGVFITDQKAKLPDSLELLSMRGNFLYVKSTGDIMKSIHECYSALFKFISERKVILKSPAGYQVLTFENGEVTTEIYMEIH